MIHVYLKSFAFISLMQPEKRNNRGKYLHTQCQTYIGLTAVQRCRWLLRLDRTYIDTIKYTIYMRIYVLGHGDQMRSIRIRIYWLFLMIILKM